MWLRFGPVTAWCPNRLFRISLWHYTLVFFTLLLGAGHAQPLTFQAATPSLVALPRETVNLALQLENTGDVPWRGMPELRLPQGWRPVLKPGELVLEPGESYLALFTVLVSGSAEAGEYTLPVTYTDPSGAKLSATYTVRVREVRALETVLLEAPTYVIAAPYTARFSVRNAGNRPEQVTLRARDNLSLALSTDPAQLRLASGEVVEVAVTAGVAADLGQSESHYLYLEASVPDDPKVVSSAGATVELISRSLSEASAYHLFPLKLRLGETLSTEPPAVPDHFGGLNLSVSGAGQLWDKDPGKLNFQLGTGSSRTGDKNLISYESSAFEVAAGEQSLALSPLTASRDGVGLSAQHDFAFGASDRFEAQVLVYGTPTEVGVGLRTSAAFGSLFELGAYSLLSGGPYGTVVGGELKLHPELGGLTELDLETEFGLQTDTGARGFRLSGAAAANEGALSASWQQAEAGFQGDPADHYALALSGSLQLYETFSTYASAKFDQKGSYLPGELLVAPPEKLERSWSGRLATSAIGVGWSLQYEHGDSFGAAEILTRTKRELTFGVSSPLADDLLLTQELSWLREFGRAASDEALGYEVSAYVPLERGSLTPRAGGEYNLLLGELSKALLGLGWSGLVGESDSVALDLEGDLALLDERSVGASVVGSYIFENGQALDLDLSGRAYYSSRKPSLKVSLGFNVPFDVRLARLSNVGEVKGRFVNEAGAGIPDLVVQLGGLSVLTQADGSFVFPAVPEGDHLLLLGAAAARPDMLAVPALPYRTSVRAGETVVAEFRMVQPAAVQGQVRFVQAEQRSENGVSAAPGEDIIFGQGRPEEEAELVGNLVVELRRGSETLRTHTNAEGRFQFAFLLPGTWQFTVLRNALPELYRLEPETRSLKIAPGGTAQVEVRLVPVARSIQFMEGGTLSTP